MKLTKLTRLASGLLLAGISLLAACPGCSTFRDPVPRVMVKVWAADRFEVEGKEYDVSQLPKAVKGAGGGPESEIMMQVPPDFPRSTLLPAYASLQKGGFKKIMFSMPREVTTQVGTPPAMSGTVKPPPKKAAPKRK